MTRLPEGNPPADGPQSQARRPTWHLAVVLLMTASVKTAASGWHAHQRRYLAFERTENLKHFPPMVTSGDKGASSESTPSDETRQ